MPGPGCRKESVLPPVRPWIASIRVPSSAFAHAGSGPKWIVNRRGIRGCRVEDRGPEGTSSGQLRAPAVAEWQHLWGITKMSRDPLPILLQRDRVMVLGGRVAPWFAPGGLPTKNRRRHRFSLRFRRLPSLQSIHDFTRDIRLCSNRAPPVITISATKALANRPRSASTCPDALIITDARIPLLCPSVVAIAARVWRTRPRPGNSAGETRNTDPE